MSRCYATLNRRHQRTDRTTSQDRSPVFARRSQGFSIMPARMLTTRAITPATTDQWTLAVVCSSECCASSSPSLTFSKAS
ncbi:unnamed protein product [Arctogadus glacialis]